MKHLKSSFREIYVDTDIFFNAIRLIILFTNLYQSRLAQSVEALTTNVKVMGSSSTVGKNFKSYENYKIFREDDAAYIEEDCSKLQ